MTDTQEFNRLVRWTAFMTVGLVAVLVFGLIVLIGGDWIPGAIIVASTVVGLAREVTVIRSLCGKERPPSPPMHKPAQ